MLHLFDKVYLEHDGYINIQFDRAVISPYTGHEILPGLDKMGYGKLLFYSTDKSVVDFNRLFNDIKEHCDQSNNRFIIYCDWATYAFIIAGWYKKFTNYTKDQFVQLLRTQNFKEKTLSIGSARGDIRDELLNHFDVWDNMQPFNVNLPNITLSLELYMANYILDKNTVYRDKVKSLVSNFYRRFRQEMLLDLRVQVFSNILSERLQRFLGADGLKDLTQLDQIPSYSLFTDPEVWNDNNQNVVGRHSSLDLMSANPTKLYQLNAIYKNMIGSFEDHGVGAKDDTFTDKLSYIVGKDLSFVELDDLLETYYLTDPWERPFLPVGDSIMYNELILIHLANLKIAGNLEELGKYSLK